LVGNAFLRLNGCARPATASGKPLLHLPGGRVLFCGVDTPEKPGVYYFYSRQRQVVYVGKAKNLKKRVAQHFSGHKITPQRQNFLKDIYSILSRFVLPNSWHCCWNVVRSRSFGR